MHVAFEVSKEIRAGLSTGVLTLHGGVVRDALTGAIVKHLKPVGERALQSEVVGSFVQGLRKIPKGYVVGLSATGVVVGLAGLGYYFYRAPVVQAVEDYQAALSEYLKAVSKGKKVDKKLVVLSEALVSLKKIAERRKLTWLLPEDKQKLLMSVLNGYTSELATANGIDYDGLAPLEPGVGEKFISDVEHYLKIQKQIFNQED